MRLRSLVSRSPSRVEQRAAFASRAEELHASTSPHLLSVRLVLQLCMSLGALSLLACASEHSAAELIARAGPRGANNTTQEPVEQPPPLGPFDAGPHEPSDVGLDAGRPRDRFDARVPVPSDGGVPDAALVDSAFPLRDGGTRDAASDANLPWQVTDSATLDVNVIATCDPLSSGDAGSDAGSDPSADAGSDAGCRSAGWHTPPCYRAPLDCPALRESIYCTGFSADGDLLLYGLDRGTSCRIGHDPRYPQGAGANSFAQIGSDIYSVDGDVILKRSITDGSFDVAAVQAWTIFALGEALVIEAVDGSIRRFANWDALKSGAVGEPLATATAGGAPAFGANRTTIAAAWPDGSLYLLTVGDARQRALRLLGYDRTESGAIRGLDLSDDGRLFLATDLGISTYNSQDGRLISRMRSAPLFGLSCEAGLAAGTTPPVLKGSPRPGYYAPESTEYVISSTDCGGVFNGPRYVGEKAGPELFVVGNFFVTPNTLRDERSTPHTLVLTTVEATQWTVTVTANSKLERILVNGSTSTVVLQSPTTIPIETFFEERSLGLYAGEWPSLEESNFRAAVEKQTGRAITEAFGCHAGSSYVIRDLPPVCPAP